MNTKDWTGNKQFIASGNNRRTDSEENDYYATEPIAVELLLQKEKFSTYVWECACGGSHFKSVRGLWL